MFWGVGHCFRVAKNVGCMSFFSFFFGVWGCCFMLNEISPWLTDKQEFSFEYVSKFRWLAFDGLHMNHVHKLCIWLWNLNLLFHFFYLKGMYFLDVPRNCFCAYVASRNNKHPLCGGMSLVGATDHDCCWNQAIAILTYFVSLPIAGLSQW